MKKIILLMVVCCVTFSNLFSQEDSKKFHFGLGVTPSMAWLKAGSNELKGDGAKIGFNYGLITEFGFTDNYAFATGISVDYKGGKLRTKEETIFHVNDSTTIIGMGNYDYSIRYIEIPATLKMKTNPIGYIRYYGQFGVAPGFLIGASGTEKLDDFVNLDGEDAKHRINNFNISLVIGLGIEYNLSGNTNLLLGVLYKNGFSDVINDDDDDQYVIVAGKAVANTIGLNVGVLF
jgi:opacity protein-like surface antigen